MPTLICGSLAYDNIMVFNDQFKNHILPEQVHILNVSFLVPELRREFGGCAGNIAYNLKILGGDPLIFATAGQDFGPYRERLEALGLDLRGVRELDDRYTAQAFITTDMDDNQITAFHPGAMLEAHHNRLQGQLPDGIQWAIVAPDGREAMVQHAEDLAAADIPFIFDPGQGLPMFNGEMLLHFFELATVVTVNDYESKLIEMRTGRDMKALARNVEAMVVTRGGDGSVVITGNGELEIPPAKARDVVDPTGCGDAYRAGLLYGLGKGLPWETTGRIASLMGAIKIESHGTQNHHFTREDFVHRFAESFGQPLPEGA